GSEEEAGGGPPQRSQAPAEDRGTRLRIQSPQREALPRRGKQGAHHHHVPRARDYAQGDWPTDSRRRRQRREGRRSCQAGAADGGSADVYDPRPERQGGAAGLGPGSPECSRGGQGGGEEGRGGRRGRRERRRKRKSAGSRQG